MYFDFLVNLNPGRFFLLYWLMLDVITQISYVFHGPLVEGIGDLAQCMFPHSNVIFQHKHVY